MPRPARPLSPAVIQPDNWTDELELARWLDTRRPLEVDLGCGKGRFLAARAAKVPEHEFLGVDRLLTRIRRTDRRITVGALANVHLLRIEAAYALENLMPAQAVSTYYLFFPDPWPKRRHHRRRLFQPAFMNALSRTLQPGGTLYVATDHLDYFADIHKLLLADTRFSETEPYVPPVDEQTDFEQLFLSEGLPIGRCGFTSTP